MNQSKFPWAIVVTIFLAVLFGIVCFMGADYLNISNETVWGMSHTFGCVVIAAVIAILLGGTATIAILLKRTSGNFLLVKFILSRFAISMEVRRQLSLKFLWTELQGLKKVF